MGTISEIATTLICKPGLRFMPFAGALFIVVTLAVQHAAANPSGEEGTVRFFVDADSSFDPWTRNPSAKQQAFMRENYFRMQTYSSYFDKRLSWYPNAWAYKNSYAIKPGWPVFREHPEWVLRDASGSMLYIPYACAEGTCPQYAADIGNPDFRAWWIAGARSKLELGYKGFWVDDVNLLWRVSNGDGEIVKPMDPRTGQQMTLEVWRRYFVEFLEELRDALPDAEIAHNFVWFAEPPDDAYILRSIDAADYIALQRGITDRGIRGGSGRFGFETFLSLVDRVHAMGKHVIMKDDDDDSVADRDYELAFYFLINNGGDLIAADGDRDRMNPNNFWSGYQIDLGAAMGERYRWRGLFRRDFECGLVLVNQPDREPVSVSLGETLIKLDGRSISAAVIGAGRGEVLTRPCQSVSPRTASSPRRN